MKVVAMAGGLGSQMFKYAFYLNIKNNNHDECYIDTAPYDKIAMWNGYELKHIFGIEAPDFRSFYSAKQIQQLIDFSGSYRLFAMNLMHEKAPSEPLIYYDHGQRGKYSDYYSVLGKLRRKAREVKKNCWDGRIHKEDCHIERYPKDYLKESGNIYYDEFNYTSDEYFRGMKERLIQEFDFPEFMDKNNKIISQKMLQEESVAIHVRRGDHMYDNGDLFGSGYFNKSVRYVKSNINNPIFYVFSDEIHWCKDNLGELGLNEQDEIYFVDWNTQLESYRDMQLMTYCKHNIIAISSFSWWGYYLSKHKKDKIVCAPKGYWFEVGSHF